MNQVSKSGVWLLALVFAALPVMACVVATPAEMECCKKMAEQCGQAGMANSHNCCQSVLSSDNFQALKATSSQFGHFDLVVFHGLHTSAQPSTHLLFAPVAFDVSHIHSPPGLESVTTTVLRI